MKTKKVSPDVFRLNHLPALGMTSVEQYMQWCKVNGFSPTTNKSKQELKAEKDHYTRVLADNALRFSSRSLTTKKFLQKIVKGEYRADANAYKYRKNTSIDTCEPEFAAFLLIVEEASDLLESSRYLPKLHSLFSWKKDWIRKPENWTTNTHNCDRQFSPALPVSVDQIRRAHVHGHRMGDRRPALQRAILVHSHREQGEHSNSFWISRYR